MGLWVYETVYKNSVGKCFLKIIPTPFEKWTFGG
jgi:hypothetical protein